MADQLQDTLRKLRAVKSRAEAAALLRTVDPDTLAQLDKMSAEELQAAVKGPEVPEQSTLSRLLPTAARVIPSVGGSLLGGAVGGPIGLAAGGALGAGAGEALAEYLEGKGLNPAQVAVQTGLGAIPFKGGSIAQMAKSGALLGAGGSVATDLAEGETPSVGRTLLAGGLGSVLGAGGGKLASRAGNLARVAPEAAQAVPEALPANLAKAVGASKALSLPKVGKDMPKLGRTVQDAGAFITNEQAAPQDITKVVSRRIKQVPSQEVRDWLVKQGVSEGVASDISKTSSIPLEFKDAIQAGQARQTERGVPDLGDVAQSAFDLMRVSYETAKKAGREPEARVLGATLSGVGRKVEREAKALKISKQDGIIYPALAQTLARTGVGAAGGAAVGAYVDDDENPLQGALTGAVLGAGALGGPRHLSNVYISSLLGAPRTQVRNVLSTAANMVMEIASTPVTSGVERALGRPAMTSVGEVGPRSTALMAGLTSGWDDFMETLRTGKLPEDFLTDLGAGKRVDDLKGLELPGGLANPLNLTSRMLAAADVWLFRAAKMQALAGLNYTRAAAKGFKGDALWAEHARLMTAPDEDISTAATAAAKRMIFKQDPSKLAKFFLQLREDVPGTELMIPFVRTVDSIFRQGLEYSGLGLPKTAIKAAMGGVDPGVEGSREWARTALGAAAAYPIWQLAVAGRISGIGPSNEADREKLRAEGWVPYSVKLPLPDAAAESLELPVSPTGQYWVPYAWFGPLAVPMASTASIVEGMREGRIDQKDWDDVAWDTVAGTAKALLNQHFMQDVFVLGESLTNGRKLGDTLQKIAVNLVPGAGLFRAITQANDPTIRNAQDFQEELKLVFPGTVGDVQPSIGPFGEIKQRTQSANPLVNMFAPSLPSAERPNPLYDIFQGAVDPLTGRSPMRSPGLPEPKIRRGSVPQTREEEVQTQIARGRAKAEEVATVDPNLPPAQLGKRLSRATARGSERATRQRIRELLNPR